MGVNDQQQWLKIALDRFGKSSDPVPMQLFFLSILAALLVACGSKADNVPHGGDGNSPVACPALCAETSVTLTFEPVPASIIVSQSLAGNPNVLGNPNYQTMCARSCATVDVPLIFGAGSYYLTFDANGYKPAAGSLTATIPAQTGPCPSCGVLDVSNFDPNVVLTPVAGG